MLIMLVGEVRSAKSIAWPAPPLMVPRFSMVMTALEALLSASALILTPSSVPMIRPSFSLISVKDFRLSTLSSSSKLIALFSLSPSIVPELVMRMSPPPRRIASLSLATIPPLLVIVTFEAPEVLSKSNAWPLAVMSPVLVMVSSPPVNLSLMRKLSSPVVMVPLFSRVNLPFTVPVVSMPRPVPRSVPSLMMVMSSGSAALPSHLIAGLAVTSSVPPCSIRLVPTP